MGCHTGVYIQPSNIVQLYFQFSSTTLLLYYRYPLPQAKPYRFIPTAFLLEASKSRKEVRYWLFLIAHLLVQPLRPEPKIRSQ